MKTLVMIPAFGCDARLYAPQIAALAGAVDIQTFIATGASFDEMVENVLRQTPDTFAILGTSMGGRLALEVAIAAPDRVEALCIIGAGAGPVADQAAGLRRSLRIRSGERDKVIAEMAEMISHLPGPRGPATQQAFIGMGLDFDMEKLALQSDALAHRADRWEELADIECLTLCLWGEHDRFSPAADGQRIAEVVQMGSYVELPDCGHFPTLEYPGQTTEAIALWLEDIDDVEG